MFVFLLLLSSLFLLYYKMYYYWSRPGPQLFAVVHSLEILAYFKVILKKLHHHKLDILSFTQSAVPVLTQIMAQMCL